MDSSAASAGEFFRVGQPAESAAFKTPQGPAEFLPGMNFGQMAVTQDLALLPDMHLKQIMTGLSVLHLGRMNDVFVVPLARSVFEFAQIRCGALGMTQVRPDDQESSKYLTVHEIPSSLSSAAGSQRLRRVFKALVLPGIPGARGNLIRGFLGTSIGRVVKHTDPRTLRHFVKSQAAYRELRKVYQAYSIFHFHSLRAGRAHLLAAVPRHAPVILSIWGSDLLREAPTKDASIKQWLCARADRITVHSTELRDVLLSRFGDSFGEKIRFVHFGSTILPTIESLDAGHARREFLEHHQIPSDHKIICISHNADPANQHSAVVRSLGQLPKALSAKITLIFPLTYGQRQNHEQYLTELADASRQSGFDFRMLVDYLDTAAVAQLRLATDFYIHLPVSDALSASLAESLCAGAIVVAGAWLPYGPLRRANAQLHLIDRMESLSSTVLQLLANFDDEKRRAECARENLRNFLDWNVLAGDWVTLYRDVYSNSRIHTEHE